ncbi:MAG: DsbC family protein [Amphritea sp.]
MRKLIILMMTLCALAINVQAEETKEAAIREALRGLSATIPITSVKPAKFPGLYEVKLASGELLYANEEGSHFLVGEVYKVRADGQLVNLTEEGKKGERLDQLAGIESKDMVVFPAQGETKAHVTVFTDVDCFYCRKLHKEMQAINSQGIEVRYLAFPRAGAGSAAHKTMESIWCADESQRGALMSKAKLGAAIEPATCDSPVLAQWRLGQKMGVNGTPALVLEDGSLVPGYVPAAQLAKMLGVTN